MRRSLLTATALAAFPFSTFAQSIGADAPADLEGVVVTAARSEAPLAETPTALTVISRDDLEREQTVVLSDALARTPGVSVNRNGGPGTVTAVRIRGAEADQTAVLIDGVKLNDPASPGGGFDFGNLLVGDVDRIEVLRGPQSVLYGSQAIGGVINVLTSPTERSGARLAVEGGSLGTAYARGGVTLGGARGRVRLGAGRFRTDGVSAFDEDLGGRERDGYEQTHATARADIRLSQALSLDLRAYRAESRTEFDGFLPDFSFGDTPEYGQVDETVAYAGATYATGRLENRLGFAFTEVTRDNFDPRAATPRTFGSEGRNERLEYQGRFDLGVRTRLTFGAETERSRLATAATAFSPALERDVRLNSAYAQASAAPLAGVTVTAGLRRDEHKQFGGATTGQAGLVWIAAATTLRANYGQGFKAPSLYQLGSEFGNAALQPEQAHSLDLGVEHRFSARTVVSATVFARETEDQIDFVYCPDQSTPLCVGRQFGGYYDNIDRTTARGLELAAATRPTERLALDLAYTLTETENRSAGDPNRARDLPRRPEHALHLGLDYAFTGGASLGAGMRRVGRSFDDAANLRPLDAYTVVALRAAAPLREGVEVYGRIENLLDDDYETTASYGVLGRTATVGLRALF